MKRKLLILVFLIFTTCGCTTSYNLKIDDNNNYFESVTLTSEGNEKYANSELYSMYLEEYPIYNSEEFLYYNPTEKLSGNTYYEKSIMPNNNGYIATYKANFNNDSYKDSRMLNNAFKIIDIGYNLNGDYYYLELNNLKIFNSENYITKIQININVSDKYVVIKNNADNISDNTYSWNFNKKESKLILRYQDRKIYDEIIKKKNEKIEEKKTTEVKEVNNDTTNNIILGIIIVLVYIVLIIIILKIRKIKK